MEIYEKRLPPRVPLEETRLPPDKLVDYNGLKQILEDLKSSPRVAVFISGKTHQNRNIYTIVISSEENMKMLFYYKKLANTLSNPKVNFRTLDDFEITEPDIENLLGEARIPVLLHAASFPMEAAHTEALLEVAKILSTSKESKIEKILEKEIVVIIPMMAPDGRELAIEEWRKFPLSDGRAGAGNARGVLLNRDFSRLAEPETSVVHQIFNEWSPCIAYDPHEDMMFLGLRPDWPELCWCPPFSGPYYKDLDKRIIDIINEFGATIAKSWEDKGVKYRYDSEGKGAELNFMELGSQRFDLHFDLHGTPTLVTESARSPGTNTWKERIDQKVTAAFAILEKIAEDPKRFMRTRYNIRKENLEKDESAFIIPIRPGKQKDPLATSMLIENLLKCKALIYYTHSPYDAYVIPTKQPERLIIIDALKACKWNPWTLAPAYGSSVYQIDSLPNKEQQEFKRAKLRLIDASVFLEGNIKEVR